MSLFISTAYAADVAGKTAHQSPMMGTIMMLVVFGVFIYFLMWRPQSKRAKKHQNLVAGTQVGDEIITSGGIHGKITEIDDSSLLLKVAQGTEIRLHKSSISSTLPKGTLKLD